MRTSPGSSSRSERRGRSSRLEEVAVRFIDTDADFELLVTELDVVSDYAIDTEFHRERTYFAQLALVQLAWHGGIAVIDPLSVDLVPLAKLFRKDAIAVLHAADQDLEVLERATGAVPTQMFDTQLAARFLGMSSPSLVSLAEKMLGLRLEKGDQLADWTRRPLRSEQLQYAAHDVAHLIELKGEICAELGAPRPARVGGGGVRGAPRAGTRPSPAGTGVVAASPGASAPGHRAGRSSERRGLAGAARPGDRPAGSLCAL